MLLGQGVCLKPRLWCGARMMTENLIDVHARCLCFWNRQILMTEDESLSLTLLKRYAHDFRRTHAKRRLITRSCTGSEALWETMMRLMSR
jgi:hypothetical protein